MSNSQLEPSVFILRQYFQEFYSGELSDTDFLVLETLYERASPADGIATVSFHGIGDLIRKPHSTVKNVIKRLVEKQRIIIEPTRQGQRAFRVGVIKYRRKNKTYASLSDFEAIFGKKEGAKCKVEDNLAKSNDDYVAKLETGENEPKSQQEWSKYAKSILVNPAKSLDIDKDPEVERKQDRNGETEYSEIKAVGQCLSPDSFFKSQSPSFKQNPSYVLKGFNLATHSEWDNLIRQFGEGKVIVFIEQTSKNCFALNIDQAFHFVKKGLEKRQAEGWQ